MKKGEYNEKITSLTVGINEVPFLISSLTLRSNELGQIDFAKIIKRMNNVYYEIWEVKSSMFPSRVQVARLKKTQDYLSQVLESKVILRFRLCQKTNDSLF